MYKKTLSFNPIAPRKAKNMYNFGLSECNWVKGRTILERFCRKEKANMVSQKLLSFEYTKVIRSP